MHRPETTAGRPASGFRRPRRFPTSSARSAGSGAGGQTRWAASRYLPTIGRCWREFSATGFSSARQTPSLLSTPIAPHSPRSLEKISYCCARVTRQERRAPKRNTGYSCELHEWPQKLADEEEGLVDVGVDGDVEETDHHFSRALMAVTNFGRRVGILRIVGGI